MIAVLYPCGSKPTSDEEAEKTMIAARPTSEAVLAPLRGIGITPEIQADFSGRMTRQQLEPNDPRQHSLLEFDEISNLRRHAK